MSTSTITIGSAQLPLEQVDESWINQQINRRRADGAIVCVQVNIGEDDVRVLLRTPSCGSSGGGGWRPPNAREQRILELWNERGLNSPDFTGGNVVAFLHQVRRLL